MPMEDELKTMHLLLPEELKRRLKITAAMLGVSMQQLMIRAITAELDSIDAAEKG